MQFSRKAGEGSTYVWGEANITPDVYQRMNADEQSSVDNAACCGTISYCCCLCTVCTGWVVLRCCCHPKMVSLTQKYNGTAPQPGAMGNNEGSYGGTHAT
jgi:hypothetical protein